MHSHCRSLAVIFLVLSTAAPLLRAQSLQGSRSSLLRQNAAAREHDFTYLRTSSGVHDFVKRGLLVRLRGDSNYKLASGYVSFPYARPEVKLFIERLSSQYRAACGERLVVTSLTRPISRQPPNASHLSVHPTGMAVDLRRSSRASCRNWLEDTLLTLEGRDVLEATRERYPPHYHVTLFPDDYQRYLGKKGVQRARSSGGSQKYRVGRGDSLWSIAKRHGVSVTGIKEVNGIRSSSIKAGQVLAIPSR